MLTSVAPTADLTGSAARTFAISFSVLMGVFGGTVVALRMRQSPASYRETRTEMALLVAAIPFAFVLIIFLIAPGVPWWLLLLSGSGFVWAGLAELLKLRSRSGG